MIAYYFLPVWAFIIWFIPLKSKYCYLVTELILLFLTVQLAYNPLRMTKITWWLHYYTLAMMIYLLILGYKSKYSQFSKSAAATLWMVFIAGDLWEIPVFSYDLIYLNGWNSLATFTRWTASHIHRVYMLATFLLFSIQTKFKFNRNNLTLMALSFGAGFILLHPYWRTQTLTIITRIITLGTFGLIVYLGLEK